MTPEFQTFLIGVLGFAVGTMSVTGIIKWIIGKLTEGGAPAGDAARYLSWAVAFVLTAIGAWTGLLGALPSCAALDAACIAAWLQFGGLVALAANAAYQLIYERVVPSEGPSA